MDENYEMNSFDLVFLLLMLNRNLSFGLYFEFALSLKLVSILNKNRNVLSFLEHLMIHHVKIWFYFHFLLYKLILLPGLVKT